MKYKLCQVATVHSLALHVNNLITATILNMSRLVNFVTSIVVINIIIVVVAIIVIVNIAS